jgi:CHASE3 domain sensor protein
MKELLEDFENAIRQLENLTDELKDYEANNPDMLNHSDDIEFALEDIRVEIGLLEVETGIPL